MSTFSIKMKIFYLCLVILFGLGVFLYLLDSWYIINLERYLIGLSDEAPKAAEVLEEQDSPSVLEWDRLKKEQKLLEDKQLALTEELNKLEEDKEKLANREEILQKKIESLNQEKEAFAREKKAQENQRKNIQAMAERLQAMLPQEAVAIASNWSNSDLVAVLLEMERNANQAGNQSIVPYLLTLMSRQRASLLMTLMMDERANAEE